MKNVAGKLPVHERCGGGYTQEASPGDGRPEFKCSKCKDTWTCGWDGGPYFIGTLKEQKAWRRKVQEWHESPNPVAIEKGNEQ